MKIVFFIGNLRGGGRERRLLELVKYLYTQNEVEIYVLLLRKYIDYPIFNQLPVKYNYIINKNEKKFPLYIAYKVLLIINKIKPNIVHTWGNEETFYSLLPKILFKYSLINNQISSAPPERTIALNHKIMTKINFAFSDIIISNSYAGIESFNPPRGKSIVIYNGIDLTRFENLPKKNIIKEKYGIKTPFAVVMVASFTKNKDYNRFIRIANIICQNRKDISFICVGGFVNNNSYFNVAKKLAEQNPLIIFTGIISEVEALVNSCDIGVLFSPYGEGISNAIIEYMALSKPVIAYDLGGTNEVIKDGENGFLIKEENDEQISKIIITLIDNYKLRKKLGENGRKKIEEYFNIQKMGKEYMNIYYKLI